MARSISFSVGRSTASSSVGVIRQKCIICTFARSRAVT